MTVAIFSASFLLLGASGALSFFGSKETVAVVVPAAKTEGTGAIDTTVNSHRQSNLRAYQRDSSAIATRYAQQIAALETAHQAGSDAAKVKLKGIEAKERNQGASFSTQKASIKQAIADATAVHAAKLAELTGAGAMEMQALQEEHTALDADLMRERSEWLTALKQGNEAATAKREKQVRTWGGSVAYFTVLCLIVLLLAIALQEVHAHGSEIHEEVLPNEYYFRQSPFAAFMAAITERYHSKVFALIKKIEDGTSEPPEPGRPPVLYEYEQRAERRPIGFTTSATTQTTNTTSQGAGAVAYETRMSDAHKYKDCVHCGQKFMPNHKIQKYCSEACRVQAWEAKNGRKPYLKKTTK